MSLDNPQENPIAESFRVMAKSMMDTDTAILNLCDVMIKQIKSLNHEVAELHNQLDILLAIYQKEATQRE